MLRVIFLGIITLLFNGCVKTINLEPKYDESNKTLNISKVHFKNVNKVSSTNRPPLNTTFLRNVRYFYNMFKINDKTCKEIRYFSSQANGRVYFLNSDIDEIFHHYKNNCVVDEKIGNLNFLICSYHNAPNLDTDIGNEYLISTSVKYQSLIKDKIVLFVGTKKNCYDYLKKEFKKELKNK